MLPWVPAILEELAVNAPLNSEELFMKIEVATTLINILQQFPMALLDSLDSCIAPTISVLSGIVDLYLRDSVRCDGSQHENNDDSCPASSVIYVYFELIGVLASQKRLKSVFPQYTAVIYDLVMKASQITTDQEEEWEDDTNQFVANENEASINVSVRAAGGELISAIVRHYGVDAANSIVEKIASDIQRSREISASDQYWWKSLEASLFVFGGISDSITEFVESGRMAFDISGFFDHVISQLLHLQDLSYLKARALWLTGKFSHSLPINATSLYCELAIQSLFSDQESATVKICAMKALQEFAAITESPIQQNNCNMAVAAILKFLPFVSEDVLLLSLETLNLILKKSSDHALVADDVSRCLASVWTKNIADQIVCSPIVEVVDLFSRQRKSYASIVNFMLPASIQIIIEDSPVQQTVDVRCSALDVLISAVKRGQSSSLELQDIFPSVLSLGWSRRCEYAEILQRVQTFCKYMVSKHFGFLMTWSISAHDPRFQGVVGNGLDLLFAFLSKMLDANQTSEEASLNTGDVVNKVLLACNAEQLNSVVPKLVPAILNRLSTCKIHTSIQHYCTNISILMINNANAVVELLSSLQVTNRGALDIFLSMWTESFEYLNGYFVVKINISALTHVLMSANPKLSAVIVKGDKIVDATEVGVIMTRSRRMQVQEKWSNIPFVVKAVKILLDHFQEDTNDIHQSQDIMSGENTDCIDDEDSWEEGSVVESEEDDYSKFDSMMAAAGDDMCLAEEDDDLVKNHPIYSVDTAGLVTIFFKHFHDKFPDATVNISTQLDRDQVEMIQRIVNNHLQ